MTSLFVGADPVGLVGLADTVEQYAGRIGLARSEVTSVVGRYGSEGGSFNSVLAVVERELGSRARELRWRAAAIDEAQQVGIPFLGGDGIRRNCLAAFAAVAVFDWGRWQEAYADWRAAPSSSQLLKMDPAEVADVFAALARSVAEGLARRNPRVVGRLDGAPPQLRYLANEILIAAEIARLEQRIEMLENPQSSGDLGGWTFGRDIEGFAIPGLFDTVTAVLVERVAAYRRWLEEGRQILLFDPAGDGRAIEVFGDLATATRVGVVIPGMGNSIANFGGSEGGFRENAADLCNASSATDRVATVAWLGYDTPDNLGAAVRTAAEDGTADLIRFLEGVDPGAEKIVTVVAHSYGSVLAGLAAGEGIAANNLVFVGSPGTTLDHAGDAVLRPGGRVWSALAEDDPIAWGIAPSELPTWPLVPTPIGYLMGVYRAFNEADELWHGTNPGSAEFGARRIATDGSSGHSSYFESGSLDNLALIVGGHYSQVELAN